MSEAISAESISKLKKRKRLITVLLILTLAFIWGQSALPVELSAKESDVVCGFLLRVFGMEKPSVDDIADSVGLVRKIAHVVEFTALGILFTSLFRTKRDKIMAVTIGHSMLVAFLDESIQILSGRGPLIQDVWIDTFGAVVGIGIVSLIIVLRKGKNHV